ncbi:ATP-binding cassette domain-containing protein [Microvirga makkahensis]|uniref:ATP-binding cassette domain-containing protein n=1 Tax=Microvirga makkahensis TaxID=1128670 RepID=A0A7X3MWN6_9HYPH|nr:ATP-binding cassette domain-containing protein [Microvirga makkahensis]MXQ14617.1 ATP-binding cassette domain-containing protein [Microvirga makkahensis]
MTAAMKAVPFSRAQAELAGNEPVVALRGITKSYGPTLANQAVDLTVGRGEVVGLVGGNGAGKSTLMRVLSGGTTPDAGELAIAGKPRTWNDYNPGEAQTAGIRIVHQELSLCGNLTVAENFYLERPDAGGLRPGWRSTYRDLARQWLDLVFPGHGINVDAELGLLPIGQRQMIEIARAASDPNLRLLVLDEPTSSLDPERSRQLRAFIMASAAKGVAFIFISHKLKEILEITSRIVALRNGRVAWEGSVEGASVERLVEAMGGESEASLRANRNRQEVRSSSEGRVLARIGGAGTAPPGRAVELRSGEIVGLAGLEGNGQRDMLRHIFGAGDSGEVSRLGSVSFVSGDRQREGVFPLWSVLENIGIGRIAGRSGVSSVSAEAERTAAAPTIERLRLDPSRLGSNILELSGGNQQKALVARALAADTEIILLDDPTRGVDVSAKSEFYGVVADMASAGRLVIWHSTEDVEFLECDRVLVFSGGRIVRELVGQEISEEAIVNSSFLQEVSSAGSSQAVSKPVQGSSLARRIIGLMPFVSFLTVLGAMASVNPLVLSPFGLDLLLGSAVALTLIALAQMFIVGGSEIDLGVGAFAGVTNVVSATLLVDNPSLGVAGLIAAWLSYGLLAAIIHARKIPAIVVTLGASFIWVGIGYSLQPTPGGSSPEWLSALFTWQIPGVPTTIVLIVIAGCVAVLIDRSPLGVVLRGFGNNPAALERGGWSVMRYAVIRYLIAGGFALVAGLSLTAINTASDINAGGPFTLLSVAAVVMGGCALLGGIISPTGVVVASLTLSLIGALLGTLGVSTDYNAAVQGGLLLLILVMRMAVDRREDA